MHLAYCDHPLAPIMHQESDGNYKESAMSDVKMAADKIRKLVAKFLKELSSKTNPSLLVFWLYWPGILCFKFRAQSGGLSSVLLIQISNSRPTLW